MLRHPATSPRLFGLDLLVVVVSKALISAAVLGSGFRAISDDDFARVVIAQTFAAAPSLDPSGTSWLPFPFWIYGGAMLVFGRGLETARGVALALGLCAPALLYAATWLVTRERRAALVSGILGGAFPYAAWMGVATVPDGFAAALAVFGVCALQPSREPRPWLVAGALALWAAALSRYEFWPVAGVASAFALAAARSLRDGRAASIATLPLLGPLGWLLNGSLRHGDPLFFLARVSAYKRALGADSEPFERVFGLPVAILRYEPELAVAALVSVALLLSARGARLSPRYVRLGLALLAQLVFLMVGELGAAGPTHHGERALLAVWCAAAVIVGDVLGRARRLELAGIVFAGGLAALILRPRWTRLDGFADREAEVALGSAARQVAGTRALAIDTSDYGYFAVIAGFAAPERARPVVDHDPRRGRIEDPFASSDTANRWLAATDAEFLVTARGAESVPASLGTRRAQQGRFLLLELSPKFSHAGRGD
jgi:hypothetical protein